MSRQLDHWLTKISAVIERQSAKGREPPRAEFADYVRALQQIALGQDATGNARDRLAALRELLKLERRGTTGYIEGASEDDPELQGRWARVRRADSLRRLESTEGKLGIGD